MNESTTNGHPCKLCSSQTVISMAMSDGLGVGRKSRLTHGSREEGLWHWLGLNGGGGKDVATD